MAKSVYVDENIRDFLNREKGEGKTHSDVVRKLYSEEIRIPEKPEKVTISLENEVHSDLKEMKGNRSMRELLNYLIEKYEKGSLIEK